MFRYARILIVVSLLVWTVGCGNETTTTTTPPPPEQGPVIAGTVWKGPLKAATVRVYSVNSNGSNGTELASGVTDSSGNFSITLSSSQTGPVRVVASGGSYKSEATGSTVTGTSEIASLIDSVTSNVSGLAVTPLSNFVSTLTRRRLSGGGSLRRGRALAAVGASATEHAAANSAVAKFFGLSGASPIETLHPKFGKSDITADPDGFKVGLATATLALEGAALAPSSPDDLLGALANDLSDGVFDGHDDTGAPVSLGGGTLPPTAGTTDFLTSLNNCITNCTTLTDNGITSDDVSGEVGDLSAGVSTSSLTPPAVGLAAGSSGAIGSMSFGGRQYVFIAARSKGIAVIDVTNPAAPVGKHWISVYTDIFGSNDVGGVIPVVGTATHPQVLAFAYGSKHVALLNAQILATGTPGVDDGSLIDFQADLPLVGSIVGFSGGSAYIAGGIPDNGRKGVWLATTDGYILFDLVTNSLTTAFPIDSTNMLAENLGGDIGHGLLLAGNYAADYGGAVQLVDLLAGKSYNMDPTYYADHFTTIGAGYGGIIDANSVDSGYQVGIFTFEDTGTAAFVNLSTITKTDGASGEPNTFVSAADGFAGAYLGSAVFSGSAVDSSTHLALFMAGYSSYMGVGQLQDPTSVPAGGTWAGLSDWSTYYLGSSVALGVYSDAGDPHAAGAVFNLGAGKPFGYLLDGCGSYATSCRALQIDMQGFLSLERAGTSGDAAHQPADTIDPAAPGGPIVPISFGP
ncbi:MAG: hypothetical protein ACE145_00600 [Terriglobia bacterium]